VIEDTLISQVKFPSFTRCNQAAQHHTLHINFPFSFNFFSTRLTYRQSKSYIFTHKTAAKLKPEKKKNPLYAHSNRKSPPFSPRKSTNGWHNSYKNKRAKKHNASRKRQQIDLNEQHKKNVLQLFVKVIKSRGGCHRRITTILVEELLGTTQNYLELPELLELLKNYQNYSELLKNYQNYFGTT
jgi:hypothetical protein